MSIDRQELLRRVREHYERSDDFNGLPVRALSQTDTHLTDLIVESIKDGELDLVRGDRHPNPHIKALPAEAAIDQISKIEANGLVDKF